MEESGVESEKRKKNLFFFIPISINIHIYCALRGKVLCRRSEDFVLFSRLDSPFIF